MPDESAPPLDERKARILDAIVREYVTHGEPVGSKRLVETYRLNVSAATVRNEMSALEESGYIAQPHTSAGRVPTDRGYRHFVDAIGRPGPLTEGERSALRGFLGSSHDLEDLLRRTTSVLAQLTRHAAMVLAPAVDRTRVKLVELVDLTPRTVLVLFISETGRVEKRMVELDRPFAPSDLARVRALVNTAAAGIRLAEVRDAIVGQTETAPSELHALLAAVAEVATVVDDDASPDRVFVGGHAALAGAGTFPGDDLHHLYELLEERLTLSKLLAESTAGAGPVVRIGEENTTLGVRSASLVTTAYGSSSAGSLGVIGPTRMDYPSVIAAVQAVADQLQASLLDLTEGE